MYFELKNIGAIKQAKIELGELTVICGKNNTGKTYITYSIYGFLYNSLFMAVEELNELYTKQLKDIFNVNAEEFSNAKFNIDIDSIKHPDSLPSPFIISAERTGIQLFQKELDKNKNELIKTLTKTRNLDLLEQNIARFALPIEENINFVRDSDNVIKSNSFLKQEYPELMTYIEEMLGVRYEIIDGWKVIIDKTTNRVLPHYMSSTSVRALFDLHMWLKHKAKKGDILFIDEPELNLHPENQVKIARLLVKLINAGIKVFVTTHSDYIIKELNNLLMFANDFPEKSDIMNQYDYTQNDILKAKDLRAYITHSNGTALPVETDEYGMIQSGFDEAIVQTNEISNQIISAIDNLLES
jgi:predicted ATP-dependent endonuclease of OLD family